MKTVLIPVADGVEDIETVTQVDVLRRAGVQVTLASIESQLEITAARGTRIVADYMFVDCADQDYDLISLPGGLPGAERLRDHAGLKSRLIRQDALNGWLGAICASPAYVLQTHGLLKNLPATCFPSFQDQLDQPQSQAVVVSGRRVTSQGPATAMAYSLMLVELLLGKEKREQIAQALLYLG